MSAITSATAATAAPLSSTTTRPVEGDSPTKAPTKGHSAGPAAIVKLSPEAQALVEKGVATFPEVVSRTAQEANAEFAAGREELKATAEKLRDAGVAPNDVAERTNDRRRQLARAHVRAKRRI